MSPWLKVMKLWIPVAIAITAACFFGYVETQQVYRMGANDPQIQLAEDGAAEIAAGDTPEDVVGTGVVEVDESLAPFVIVFDARQHVAASSGRLDGRTPEPPQGVLDHAASTGENRVTWEPRSGVRIATVVVAVDSGESGFVLAGRSLREAEDRIGMATKRFLAIYGGAMVLSLVVIMFFTLLEERIEQDDPEA